MKKDNESCLEDIFFFFYNPVLSFASFFHLTMKFLEAALQSCS